jgi:hypothetical protein
VDVLDRDELERVFSHHGVVPMPAVLASALVAGALLPLALDAILRPNAAVTEVPSAVASVLVTRGTPLAVAALLVLRSAPRLSVERALGAPGGATARIAAVAAAAACLSMLAAATAVFGGQAVLAASALQPHGTTLETIRATLDRTAVLASCAESLLLGATVGAMAEVAGRAADPAVAASRGTLLAATAGGLVAIVALVLVT